MVRIRYVLVALVLAAAFAPAASADTVPDVVGLSVDEATSLLEQAGFKAAVNRVPGATIGQVISQKPGGLCERNAGETITLTVVGATPKTQPGATPPDPIPTKPSDAGPDGPPTGPGSDPLGNPPGGAPTDPMPADPNPSGPTSSAPGAAPPTGALGALPRGRLPNNTGPAIPSVLGQPTRQAQAALRRWKVSVEYTLGVPTLIGKVVNQRPHSGTQLAAGEAVILVVALGETPSADHRSVPQMEGSEWNNAVKAAQNWGFTCDVYRVPSSEGDRGMVVQQTPLPGSLAVSGTQVRLLVGEGSGGATPAPAGPAPVDPGPMDAPPAGPPPTDPTPVNPPTPVPSNPPPSDPAPAGPAVNLGTPGLQSPPAGESYPYRYGATFTWTSVSGASQYEWELQEELPSGAWQKVETLMVNGARYRPDKLERGRYRWRVRAVKNGGKGAWSMFRRLYMY